MSVGAGNGKPADCLRAVVADDEPTAREYLKLLLSRIGGIEVVGEADSAADCLRAVSDARPDVLFLDIHMPDSSGVDVARALTGLSSPPAVVFVTGYDEYAVPAFELAATDYVTKPFNQERLEKTISRLRSLRPLGSPTRENGVLSAAGKLAIKNRDGAKIVDASEVCYIRTNDRKTLIYTVSGSHPTHYTLTQLEQRLRGLRFFRANEGCLVNLDHVKEVVHLGSRSYELLLTEPRETFIPVSRARLQELWEVLGL